MKKAARIPTQAEEFQNTHCVRLTRSAQESKTVLIILALMSSLFYPFHSLPFFKYSYEVIRSFLVYEKQKKKPRVTMYSFAVCHSGCESTGMATNKPWQMVLDCSLEFLLRTLSRSDPRSVQTVEILHGPLGLSISFINVDSWFTTIY